MEQVSLWNQSVEPGFYTDNSMFYDDSMSQYDGSSYAPSMAPSDQDYNQRGFQQPQYSARGIKTSRRQSQQSVARDQYDSGFHSASTTFSPVEMEFFPPQTYSYGYDMNQGFAEYDSSHEEPALFPGVSDSSSSTEQSIPASPVANSDAETSNSSLDSQPARNDPLYNAIPHEDGMYHCPFEGSGCDHTPKPLKCEYDKYIDSHLKPFRCRNPRCSDLQFSSTACLLRHEREAHEMHGHAESLCEYPPCNRAMPGNGFRRSYNCKDHMTRCHGWVDHNPPEKTKRRSAPAPGASGNKVSKVRATKGPSKKQQIAQLREEFATRRAVIEKMSHNLTYEDGPMFTIAMTQMNAEMQTLKSIQHELDKLTGKHMG